MPRRSTSKNSNLGLASFRKTSWSTGQRCLYVSCLPIRQRREALRDLHVLLTQIIARLIGSTGSLDAVITGGTFSVTTLSGPRSGRKSRFVVEKVEPPVEDKLTPYSPYFCNHASSVQLLADGETVQPTASNSQPKRFEISSDGIGGLHKQIIELNERLVTLTSEVRRRKYPLVLKRSTGILLHGPEGTGKSLLLRKIAEAPWKKAIFMDEQLTGTFEKNQTILKKAFEEAKASQPSVIIFDKLDVFAPKNDENSPAPKSSLARSIAVEMDKLGTARVLLIGASTRLADVDTALRTPELFAEELEIPVPDAKARVSILKVLREKEWQFTDEVAENVGGRTHGFVGRDLAALHKKALKRACDRYFEQNELAESTDGNPDPVEGQTSGETQPPTEEVGAELPSNDEASGAAASVLQEDFEDALLKIRPTAMNEVFLETPKVKWSDIGGSEGVKAALREVTEWPFRHPEDMEDLDLQPQRGILLYGPPGCSKTLCAKAVATESDLNFLAVKGAELTSMYVGETERAVREVFRKARAASPSIIFFDEIDSIASSRESGKQLSGLNVLTTLLNEMDGIESLKGVLVLAATNRPDVLDSALMRPGRFDAILYVGPPNLAARKQIVEIGTRKRPLGDDFEVEEMALLTEGYSGAEIIEICAEAARMTLRDRLQHGDKRKIGREQFTKALHKTPKRITKEMTDRYENWSIDDAIKRL
ncbi:uncharacterized protein K452DRAFT_221945 [Aplosporella prunicola CBS 121167]|uniref:AAA+ ATPase domain-containing protein n=1 Tax=Aplosporella prunicola CBS 121167 TaxID=1176127 RepID=A0A6A6BLG4_9PEZI|nr:uncharacterized protein K452DRAFT_221945 [Aplosporella prunicola CBS 121167]KAF2144952.1 hypothetical protein K452DRAFT_221945 [Aplosporella prunicola CBS 121167]